MDRIVLDNLTVAVMAIDKNYRITVANKMCKTILNIEPEEALGKHIDEFFNNPPEFTRTVQHSLEQGKNFRYDIFPYTWGPYEKTLSQRSTVLRNEEGEIIGAMIEFEDITEKHKRDEEYRLFMEESSVNIIPVEAHIGMLVLQNLPFDVSPHRFGELGANAMKTASDMELKYIVLDASNLPSLRVVSMIAAFNAIVEGFLLMGIKVIISGIRPEVAIQATREGINFKNIRTFSKMSQALEYLRKNMGDYQK